MTVLSRMSDRERRVLVAGALTIVSVIAVSRGAPLISQWEARQVARAREARLERGAAEASAIASGAMRDSLVARGRRRDSLLTLLVSAPSAQAAAAGVGVTVERLARTSDVRVTGLTMMADSTAVAGLARVGVRLSGESDVAGLIALLLAIETRRTPLNVTYISVAQPDPAGADANAEALRFDLVIQTVARLTPGSRRSETHGE